MSFSSGIASKNIYLYDHGRVVLDDFSHCISMISPFDGKLRRQIYDYTDDLKDVILYLAPEIIYQVSLKSFKNKNKSKFYLFSMQQDIILKVMFIVWVVLHVNLLMGVILMLICLMEI